MSDQPKNMWAARRESMAAKSYMDELLIVAARTMPDEDGNLDVGLLEPNARRTEIGRDRLNVNDTDAEACWTFEYDLDIRTARLEVTVSIRPVPRTTDNEDDDAAE